MAASGEQTVSRGTVAMCQLNSLQGERASCALHIVSSIEQRTQPWIIARRTIAIHTPIVTASSVQDRQRKIQRRPVRITHATLNFTILRVFRVVRKKTTAIIIRV